MMHVPEGANIDAKRKMLRKINAAIVEAYHLPKFMIFMQEYPLDPGSRGLGRSIFEALLARGADVTVVARDERELAEVAPWSTPCEVSAPYPG
jgi:hypothetical protein